jgi:hypothetical protein
MGTTLKLLQWKALLMVDFDPFWSTIAAQNPCTKGNKS